MAEGKISFKKPKKREVEVKEDETEVKKAKKSEEKPKKKRVETKLLSFGDDEDEEDCEDSD